MDNTYKNKNILISGFYGFGNAGDEAILYSMVTSFRKLMPEAGISVLSNGKIDELSDYNVNFVNRKNYFSILKAMFTTTLFISGGGGLIQDITSVRSIRYYLNLINLAKLFRKKVMVYAQGIGPVDTDEGKKLTSETLNRVDYITVRDEASKELLLNLGLNEKLIEVTADPVLMLEGQTDITNILSKYDINKDNVNLGIAVRPWGVDYLDKLASFLNNINKKYPDIKQYLLPFQLSTDLEQCLKLKEKLVFDAIVINEKLSTLQLLSLISNFNYMAAMRLHAAIMGAVNSIPSLGIIYDPKVKSFFELMNLPSVDIKRMELNLMDEKFDYLLKNNEQVKKNLKENVSSLKKKACKNNEIVMDLLK
ncbi:MAG: polysaccharide pyruvyl transferase CsaB [Armatimonadota bacterium]